jgi:hypothetical protein
MWAAWGRMKRRRLPIYALAVGTLVACVGGAAGAEQRAYTCAAGASGFGDAHCTKAGGGFGHVEIPEGEATSIRVTNGKTIEETKGTSPLRIKSQVGGGFEGLFKCGAVETVSGKGTLTNGAKAVRTKMTLEATGCAVLKPEGFGCVIEGGTILTNPLVATTEGQAVGNVKFFTEEAGEKLLSINIEKCSFAGFNGKYVLHGSFLAQASGATLTASHGSVTSQGTLQYAGTLPAGIEVSLTVSKEGGSAIALT